MISRGGEFVSDWKLGQDQVSNVLGMEVLAVTNEIPLQLSHDQALVLFEWLARTGNARVPVAFEDQAEQRVLWDLESALEAVLPEPLSADYRVKLEVARERIRDSEE